MTTSLTFRKAFLAVLFSSFNGIYSHTLRRQMVSFTKMVCFSNPSGEGAARNCLGTEGHFHKNNWRVIGQTICPSPSTNQSDQQYTAKTSGDSW